MSDLARFTNRFRWTRSRGAAWSILALAALAPACGEPVVGEATAVPLVPGSAQGGSARVLEGVRLQAMRSATKRWDELVAAAAGQPQPAPRVVPAPVLLPPDVRGTGGAAAVASALSAAGVPFAEQVMPSPAPAASFFAHPMSSNPPDTMGAVGPNHLLVTLNGAVRIQTKTGGVVSSTTLDGFFAPVSPGGAFDPTATYDPLANRFVVVCMAADRSPSSSVLVAASQTDDPTGAWHFFRFDADPADIGWADFGKFGVNKNWFIMHTPLNETGTESGLMIVCDKAALYAGTASCKRFDPPGRFMPAVSFDPTHDTAYLMRITTVHSDGRLSIDTVTGPVADPVLTMDASIFTLGEPFLSQGGPMMPQLGTTLKIWADPGGNVSSLVFRHDSLWGALTACVPIPQPTRCQIRWFQATPDGMVQQFGTLDDPSGAVHFTYASLAVNRDQDVLIGFARFTAEQFPAAGYAFRSGTDTTSTLRADHVLRPSEAFWSDVRWGDYSATMVDPANDLDLWTIQEYASPGPTWNTWWGKVTPPGPSAMTTLSPAADAYVQDGSSANTNFGNATTLQVKSTATTGTNRWAYLRFPLTGVTGSVSTARLRLHGSRPTTANGIPDSAFAVSSTTWTETGITWNNKPALGAAQGFGVAIHTNAHYYEWDVTSFVKAQKAANATAVSLAVRMDANVSIGPDTFSSRQAASNRPELVVVFSSVSDAPPTVETPAAASPAPVTGTTTALSVLGADDGGEAALTYTWSATGPAGVTFSANGSNGAKNTTATFTQAGSYSLLATITDAGNQTVTSSVTVTVDQTLTTITVAPASASVPPGGTQQFTATARDQFGAALATQPSFTWTVSGGGTISATGNFTADGTPGGPFTVTATSGGKSGTAQVTVTGGGTTTTLSPVADAHVRDGTSADTNFGTDITLVDKNSTVAGNHRRTFLRFAITSLGSTIDSAKVRLHGSSVTSAKLVGIFAVSNITWGETTITWNSAPTIGPKQGASNTVGTTAALVEWDVTSYVQAQKAAGATAVSFELKQDIANNETPTTFSSREAATNRPEMVVVTP